MHGQTQLQRVGKAHPSIQSPIAQLSIRRDTDVRIQYIDHRIFVISRLRLKILQASHDAIDIVNGLFINGRQIFIIIRCRLNVILQVGIGNGSINIGHLYSSIVIKKKVDCLHFGDRIDRPMIKKRRDAAGRLSEGTHRTAIEFRVDIIGRRHLHLRIRKHLVGDHRILHIVVDAQTVAILIRVRSRFHSVLTSTHSILRADAIGQNAF